MINIGVNGFGRIGRYFTRLALLSDDIQVAVVNDVSDIQTLMHLLKYDSIHRGFPLGFAIEGNTAIFENGKRIVFTQESNPASILWGKFGVETVIESTGQFLTKELASAHLTGGAKRVIISAPAIGDDIQTIVLGVNEDSVDFSESIISNASCTTNNAAPMLKVMRELCEIESAYITTVHSYTTDQRLHDAPHRDLRRARAAATSIVPTTTGAAKALTRIFPDLEGCIGGCGVRVPVPDGSFTDLTMVVKNPPSVEVINAAMKRAAESSLKGILAYTEDPIVSVDVIGNPNSCLFDAQLTSVVHSMVKVVGWYDNEAGYSNRLIDLVRKLGQS
ncbi:MAG: type I glyceraldehyde-3-phosphate dehydrogenase [Flavobacteriia bacterium]|jgi:glyceraldehyde 3-phosphate dehydrogenase|nr:type I glyceraldehyde-3-phosphate dehydrogenase [Cryomorphaceae bacterium]